MISKPKLNIQGYSVKTWTQLHDRSLPVPHPDFVAATPRLVVVVSSDGSRSVVEPLIIVSLDYDARKGIGD
jgi:hypothetical protein